MTSPLKWLGSKKWALPRLRELYAPHQHRRLVEPFVGGMTVALGLEPKRALLNDVNPHLINFYDRLRDTRAFEIEMSNTESLFYCYRDCFNELISTSARYTRIAAELFYYLNRTGFNGVCRFNKSGGFNVPYGKYASVNYRRDFSEYAPLLSKWDLQCGSFQHVKLLEDDFLYCDPPYDGTFTDYSAGGFSWEEQVQLAHYCAGHRGPVVVSNQATDRIVKLYRDLAFHVEVLPAPRSVSSNGDRTPAMEMLATNIVEAYAA